MSEVDNMASLTKQFFRSKAYVVVGASTNPTKFGNMVFRALYNKFGKEAPVLPVNPKASEIDGVPAFATVADALSTVEDKSTVGVSMITPPAATEKAMEVLIEQGIKNVWMQPGAESEAAIENGKAAGISIISGGPCVLVELGVAPH
eukprot:m.188658 g.188658  ORF g.188658 m.188658 type:complete len:147 (-) comp14789_c0_seq1:236-676(-)